MAHGRVSVRGVVGGGVRVGGGGGGGGDAREKLARVRRDAARNPRAHRATRAVGTRGDATGRAQASRARRARRGGRRDERHRRRENSRESRRASRRKRGRKMPWRGRRVPQPRTYRRRVRSIRAVFHPRIAERGGSRGGGGDGASRVAIGVGGIERAETRRDGALRRITVGGGERRTRRRGVRTRAVDAAFVRGRRG